MDIAEVVGLVLLGLFAGSLGATLGGGGGIIYVPALVSVFGYTQLEAQGTSLAVIFAASTIATLAHSRAGRVVWKVAFVAVGFGIFFALGGARLALSMDEEVLRRVFAVVVAILSVRMSHRAWTLRTESLLVGRGRDPAS